MPVQVAARSKASVCGRSLAGIVGLQPAEGMHVCLIPIVKPTRCTNVSNLFYFGMTLYMFRTVFPSIISSPRLYIQ